MSFWKFWLPPPGVGLLAFAVGILLPTVELPNGRGRYP